MAADKKLTREGEIVPNIPPAQSGGGNVGGYFDLVELGIDADPAAFADSFELPGLPGFTFRIRMVSDRIKENDDAFPLRAVAALGLEERAQQLLAREGVKDPDEQHIQDRALLLLGQEVFRVDPAKSRLFESMVRERHDAVIIGNPESDDPSEWGGLVKWLSNQLPYSVKNARAANLLLKRHLYTRIMALAKYGFDDAQFRPQNSGSN